MSDCDGRTNCFDLSCGVHYYPAYHVPELGAVAEEKKSEPVFEDPSFSEAIERLAEIREFASGATRDTDEGKLDFEGFFAPGVMFRFAQYMNENRVQSDGNLRASDNWQKGIPRDQYMKSMYRHFMEVWANHRALQGAVPIAMADEMETALCAMMFNVMGYLFEMQQGR